MSSDLDKLMGKLNVKSKPVDDVTDEDLEKLENSYQEIEEDEYEDDDEEVEEKETPKPKPKETSKVKEKPTKEDQENPIEAEVGFLQNNGIFRRELLLTLKELVDVQKVNAEILISIKKDLKK